MKNSETVNDKTNDLIRQLADKLGTTTQYLWSVLIKQAQLAFVMGLIEGILLLVVSVAVFFVRKAILKGVKNRYKDYTDSPEYVITTMAAFIISAGCLFLGIELINSAIIAKYNPEYWALSQIFKQISHR